MKIIGKANKNISIKVLLSNETIHSKEWIKHSKIKNYNTLKRKT